MPDQSFAVFRENIQEKALNIISNAERKGLLALVEFSHDTSQTVDSDITSAVLLSAMLNEETISLYTKRDRPYDSKNSKWSIKPKMLIPKKHVQVKQKKLLCSH